MTQTLFDHDNDAIELARLRQRVHALEIENKGLRHEVARLTRVSTAAPVKTKAKR